MCDTKKPLFVKPSPKTASLADRNREGVKTSFADLDPLVQTAAEILGQELQQRLFVLRPSNLRCVEHRMSKQGDVMSSKSSMLTPSKSSLARRRTCRPSGLLNRRDSVRRSLRCARLRAKHLHHTNAAEGSSSRTMTTTPNRLKKSPPMRSCLR